MKNETASPPSGPGLRPTPSRSSSCWVGRGDRP